MEAGCTNGFEQRPEPKYFSFVRVLPQRSFSEASLKAEVIFLNLPPCIIHGLAAAVGLLLCHGLFTEPLVNPLAGSGGVPRLIYKKHHMHMSPFITSLDQNNSSFNLDAANLGIMQLFHQ